jgi:hypothetical protein
MTEVFTKPSHDFEREALQNHLAAIDHDPARLQDFVRELYGTAHENPQLFYAATTHLTSLTFLERRTQANRIMLPDTNDAGRAFATYTQLLTMLHAEKNAPLYADNARIYRRLTGSREELAFHASLAYATAQGADFVALPTPASVDFSGAEEASDIQLFFAGADQADLEIQVKVRSNGGYNYHPRIAVLSLEAALRSKTKAGELRSTLLEAGKMTDGSEGATLPPREHDIIMSGAAAIMKATYDWGTADSREIARAA